MFRRLAFLSLALGLVVAAACGRQVTPSPGASSNLSGKMVIRFRVRGTLDFNNVNYVIVFNTTGTGGEPYPQAELTSFANFSYAFAVGADHGGAGVTLPTLFQYIVAPGTSNNLNPQPVQLGASTTQFIPMDSLANNEFQLTFTRLQLDNPLMFNATATPGATLSPVASLTPSPAATTAAPSAPPSGFAPTNTPLALATSQAQRTWFINFFTIDRTANGGSGAPLDSLGIGGAKDTSFNFTIDTATQNLQPVFRPSGITYPSNLSAAIDGGEVDNYP